MLSAFSLLERKKSRVVHNLLRLMAIIAGCRAGEERVVELCRHFSKETYLAVCQALLDHIYRAMMQLVLRNIPEEPQSFEG